ASSSEIDALVRERLKTDGALYKLDLEELRNLEPDLIVTQALCDVCAVAESEVQAAACSLPNTPAILNLEPETLTEVFDALRQLGSVTGIPDHAEDVIGVLTRRVDAVVSRSQAVQKRHKVAFLEWIDPLFSCGHWTPELVEMAGGIERLGQVGQPSRILDWMEVIAWQPEVIFIACCGFDLPRTLEELSGSSGISCWPELPAVESGRVYVTDGSQFFSRPGPRLVDSLEILAHALHPEVHPLPPGLSQDLAQPSLLPSY
ncbi:MAG TPA: cobalamin-binding protein, partial [Gemmatimonadetes bacterium]|nr:cobalamin-binding protein [Gemmatimonadota bacterium]